MENVHKLKTTLTDPNPNPDTNAHQVESPTLTLTLTPTPTLILTHVKVRAFFQEFRALLLRMENVHKLKTSACLCCYKVLPKLHNVNFGMMVLLNLVMIAEPTTYIEDRYAVRVRVRGRLYREPVQ